MTPITTISLTLLGRTTLKIIAYMFTLINPADLIIFENLNNEYDDCILAMTIIMALSLLVHCLCLYAILQKNNFSSVSMEVMPILMVLPLIVLLIGRILMLRITIYFPTEAHPLGEVILWTCMFTYFCSVGGVYSICEKLKLSCFNLFFYIRYFIALHRTTHPLTCINVLLTYYNY